MKILLLQPHRFRLELGGKRSPSNRSGVIYKMLINSGHDVTIGTTIESSNYKTFKNDIKYKLIHEHTKQLHLYDLIVILSGSFNYCFPPNEQFDDKKRCIKALLKTDCPVIFVQDEYITTFAGYPSDITPVKRLYENLDNNLKRIDLSLFKTMNMHKNRKIKILVQCKYPKELAFLISDKMNLYSELNFEFINWGIQQFAFKDMILKPSLDTNSIITYIGVMRPNRSRLKLIDSKYTNIYGRWKHHMKYANHFNGCKVEDVPSILNKTNATIWTHDDMFKEMSVETARLYEVVRSGCPLLVDKIMWKNKEDCYLYDIDCFYETKRELWEKVAQLHKNKQYRNRLVKQQQEALVNYINYNNIIHSFNKIITD